MPRDNKFSMAAAVRSGVRLFPRVTDGITRCLGGYLPQAASGVSISVPSGSSNFHTCSTVQKENYQRMLATEPKKWPRYNEIVYPPRSPEEPQRPSEIFHHMSNIKYSPKKMWYIAHMIKGMSIDEAVKQLTFVERRGAEYVKEALLEAQEIAVRDHNVEFKSNLWVAESFAQKSKILKGLRRHARGRYGRVDYKYIHYFVCLREGPPPKHYMTPEPTGHQQMAQYIQDLRNRRVTSGL